MTSNSRVQHLLHVTQRSRKKSRWGVVIGIALLGVLVSASAQAALFTVNNTIDLVDAQPGDGVCDIAPPSNVCTLRAAIMEANHAPGGPHTVSIPSGTYTLMIPSTGTDGEAAGALKIAASMSIIGAGSSTTIINANGSVTSDRGLRVVLGITANIAGVTIRNGAVSKGGGFSANGGGGIYNLGTLTLTDTTVMGNSAGFASGILNDVGTLILIDSTVSGNSARGVIISGINISHSGGIFNGGALTLINSTVSNNHADGFSGGIGNDVTLTMINSTVSGNTANGNGGGIWSFGTVNSFNSTITDNRADADLNGSGVGGGVFNGGATFNFQNTIIAGNFETVFNPIVVSGWLFVPRDCAGLLTSNGNNLMRVVNCNVNGSAPTVANPLLGPLQNNGGPTQTHALLAGSPAIDGGDPSGCLDQFGVLILTDQRGLRRTVDGNRDGTARCDIGAVEFGSGAGVTFYSDVDFDGDGRNDIGVYRDGTWFIFDSSMAEDNGGFWRVAARYACTRRL